GTRPCVVFHAGSLGDSVMIWPLLRTLMRRGGDVTLVSTRSKGALAESVLNSCTSRLSAVHLGTPSLREGTIADRLRRESASPVELGGGELGRLVAEDIERPRFNALWGTSAIAPDSRNDRVAGVISFLVEPGSDVGRSWAAQAAELFPHAEITLAGAPGSRTRDELWALLDVHTMGIAPAAVARIDAPLVLHVGAGGDAKRWPLERFIALRDVLAARGHQDVRLIAGEVEQERFAGAERAAFDSATGQIIGTLAELARVLAGARLVVASDTGPGHLAAQLGVPTLSLFGPTDASVWSPTGPQVRVLSPPQPSSMQWLAVDEVGRACGQMLSEPQSHRQNANASQ
ncbi:MAG: glycosyltransferase family 9 protein, partial [Phycisphaerales bacterium]|nr:glycosyltransferase family 9 protein [Phycisphaerales bacterium]